MGDRLMPPEIGNPFGFYEDLDFVELHERILEKNNSMPLNGDFSSFSITPEIEAQAHSLIQQKNTDHTEWGWKDPRTCLFFNSIWQKDLPNARVIIIYRHYKDVINSLINRDFSFLLRKIQRKSYFKGQHLLARALNYIYKNFEKRTIKYANERYSALYLKSWISYNNYCLSISRSLGNESCLILSVSDLLKTQGVIEQKLEQDWQFNLDFIDANTIWHKEKLKNNRFLFEPELEKQAQSVMTELIDASISSIETCKENRPDIEVK